MYNGFLWITHFALAALFRGSTDGQEAVQIALQRKKIDALKVDVSEGNWRNVRQNVIARNRLAGFPASFQKLMFPGVVSDDGIGEQGQRAADRDFLVPSTPAIDANRTRVNDALKLVDGFPADQYSVDAAPKWRRCGVVAQVYAQPFNRGATSLKALSGCIQSYGALAMRGLRPKWRQQICVLALRAIIQGTY